VTYEGNAMLIASFSEEEIKEAVFSSYAEGALGLMGFLFFAIRNFGILLREL
jgi:hypothetical protein